MASTLIAMLVRSSAIGRHRLPLLVVFQIPPETPAAYMILGFFGWMTRARVRPPMLPGPRYVQLSRSLAASPFDSPCAEADDEMRSPRFVE